MILINRSKSELMVENTIDSDKKSTPTSTIQCYIADDTIPPVI